MTASRSVPSSASARVIAFPGRQSCPPLPRYLSGRGAGVDPLAFYAAFPDRWRDLLQAQFNGPVAVAAFFRVTEKAAQKWWNGEGGPQGAKLAYALAVLDGAAEALIGRAA